MGDLNSLIADPFSPVISISKGLGVGNKNFYNMTANEILQQVQKKKKLKEQIKEIKQIINISEDVKRGKHKKNGVFVFQD